MCEWQGHTESQSFALSDSVTVLELQDAFDTSRSKSPYGPLPLPRRCWLDYLCVYVVDDDGEPGPPETVTMGLTRDEEGRVGIGNRLDSEGETAEWEDLSDAQKVRGYACFRIDLPFGPTPESDRIYARISGDNETSGLTVRIELHWRVIAKHELTCKHRNRLHREDPCAGWLDGRR